MAYRVFETEQFQKDLRKLGPSVDVRLEKKLRGHVYPALADSPRYGPNIKRLQGYEPPTWRYRVGAWRFFYTIDDAQQTVFLLTADWRSRAYR